MRVDCHSVGIEDCNETCNEFCSMILREKLHQHATKYVKQFYLGDACQTHKGVVLVRQHCKHLQNEKGRLQDKRRLIGEWPEKIEKHIVIAVVVWISGEWGIWTSGL